ncbi:MAG: HDOD domain-containing protein [Deltaproteobacteria bacterium]|nr:HDOD domain-containing protein [Deltaproteobacteria bacterium]
MHHYLSFKRNSVSSGSYVISNRKNEILNAYLGTCVGVAIYDPVNGIGGLIHLLLAEPTIEGNTMGRPENYASTGLPMFIGDLYKNGAKKEHLKAVVAGGVLVGPVSGIDINLDIGGRTTEIVERLLRKEGIPIVKMETGGYFSCCLSINLSNWESGIDLINMPDESHEVKFNRPTKAQLERAMADVRPIPQIVLRIIRMIQDENCSMSDLAKEVRQEQVITAKVIRLCNTAFFRQRLKVDSIDRALLVLGEKRLLQLAISASMEDFFPGETGGYSLCKGGLFNHAVGSAVISEKLAAITGLVPEEIAYTAGLLHDIGKVALDQYMGLAYPLFYRKIQFGDESLINVENEIFGATHTEIGGILAEQWSMPEKIGEVIKFHHTPEQACFSPELTHIVYFADLILSRFMVGNELDRLNTDDFTERLKRIGIRPEQFPGIIEKLSGEISHLSLYEKE